jgi:3-dehydroquinate synthetase
MISPDELALILELTCRYGLMPGGISVQFDALMEHMKYDKKNSSGRINFVLLNGIGNPVTGADIDGKLLRPALEDTLAAGG